MKRWIGMLLTLTLLILCTACGASTQAVEPSLEQAQSICELATMECYYHNTARIDDTTKILLWTRDKKCWIEYTGIVKLGVDASQISLTVEGEKVTITIPQAEVLSADPDDSYESNYITEKGSVKISAKEEADARAVAQESMKTTAAENTALMNQAQERAKLLLEEYVNNIGEATGVDYEIEWVELEAETSSADSSAS